MDEATRLVSKSFSQGLKTDSVQTIDEWATENRVLTSESSAEPGPWRNDRTPYLIEPMRCLSTTSPVERTILMFGSQLGKSELGNNFLGYIMHKAPAPIIMVQPTVEMAKDYGRTRIDKMIATVPALSGKVAEARSRDAANTLTMKEFPGGYLFMTGSNSPATLSSKPIRYSFQDEVDRFTGNVGGEGDPCALVFARQRTFSRRKSLITSTPTISGRSRVEKFWEDSDKRRYYVPCPHCGHMQTLKFQNLKWEKGRTETAWYECESKGCRIENADKTWMLSRGEWRPDVKDYQGLTAGFQLSSLYSPVGWFSWQEIAAQFLEAGKNKELLQVFWNTVLGEPWVEIYDGVEWESLYHRREDFMTETVPWGGLFLTAGADVQNTWLEVTVRAWGRGLESWVVGHYRFYGNTADISDQCWKDLDALLARQFPHEGGTSLPIAVMAIDTGGTRSEDGPSHTQVTYRWCRKYPPSRVMPVKGQSSLAVMVGQPKGVDVDMGNGKKKKNALKLFSVGVDIIKSELAGWLRLERPSEGENCPPGYIHFASDLEEEFFKSLTGETLHISETKTGRKVYEWKKLRPRQEVWDTMVYTRAALGPLQVDKFKDREWDRLEAAVQGEPNERNAKQDPAPKALNAPPPAAPVMRPATKPVGRRVMSRGVSI